MIRHIPGVDNSVVDALSRLQLSRFRSLAPRADPTPTTTPAEPTYTSNSASLHFRLQEQGVADSTQRTYKSGVQAFSTFCRSYGQSRHLNSPSGTLWPTSTARYPVSYATIKVFLSAIRLLHLEHHCRDPLTNSPLLPLPLSGSPAISAIMPPTASPYYARTPQNHQAATCSLHPSFTRQADVLGTFNFCLLWLLPGQ